MVYHNLISGEINLLHSNHYTAAVMVEDLENIVSTGKIKQDEIPLGILSSVQSLFYLGIQAISGKKHGGIYSSRNYYRHPFAPPTAYLLLADIMRVTENLNFEAKGTTKQLEFKIREFYEFSKTLDKPRKVNKKFIKVADRLSRFFKELSHLASQSYGEKYSFSR